MPKYVMQHHGRKNDHGQPVTTDYGCNTNQDQPLIDYVPSGDKDYGRDDSHGPAIKTFEDPDFLFVFRHSDNGHKDSRYPSRNS